MFSLQAENTAWNTVSHNAMHPIFHFKFFFFFYILNRSIINLLLESQFDCTTKNVYLKKKKKSMMKYA